MPLVPCPACRRHVRGGDAACPFCASALPTEIRAVPSASSRLGRGALFAFAVSVAACGGSTESEGVTDTGASSDASGDAAKTDSSPSDALDNDTGGPVAAYGAPADTGVADTGDTTDSGGPAPAYGLPPDDGG